jgi:hypothetical protein
MTRIGRIKTDGGKDCTDKDNLKELIGKRMTRIGRIKTDRGKEREHW